MTVFDNDDPPVTQSIPLFTVERGDVLQFAWPSQLSWRALCLTIFLLVASTVFGQEHHHPAGRETELHDKFYSTWLMPNGGSERKTSCCNRTDCYSATVKLEYGSWFARRREDGVWVRIPPTLIEQYQSDPRESPDHQPHVCMSAPPNNNVYCFTFGGGV